MKYKIGDKVRVVKSLDFPEMIGKMYTVTVVLPPESCFICRVIDEKTGWAPLMYASELEPAIEVGKQLEFSFMQTDD